MDEVEEFAKYAMQQMQLQVKEMVEDANRILRKNVMNEIYSYTPQQYRQTHDLVNSITEEIQGIQGYIYFDNDKLHYTSAVTDEDVSKYVPFWVDRGHSDSTGINNLYHNYPSNKNFLQKTIEELEEKYGKGCVEIVGNPY